MPLTPTPAKLPAQACSVTMTDLVKRHALAEAKTAEQLIAAKAAKPSPAKQAFNSESAKWRSVVSPYCQGNGCEIATGGDPITPTSIQFELPPREYAVYNSGQPLRGPVHWRSTDAVFNLPFKDGVLDYLASSHLLEDFLDWRPLLTEWVRVIRPGGRLVICLPDRVRWNKAVAGGQCPNLAHKHESYMGELTDAMQRFKLPMKTIVERFTELPPGDYNIFYCGKRLA